MKTPDEDEGHKEETKGCGEYDHNPPCVVVDIDSMSHNDRFSDRMSVGFLGSLNESALDGSVLLAGAYRGAAQALSRNRSVEPPEMLFGARRGWRVPAWGAAASVSRRP